MFPKLFIKKKKKIVPKLKIFFPSYFNFVKSFFNS